MSAAPAVAPEGAALLLESASGARAHKHPCYAILSAQVEGLVPMYCARWLGSKTSMLRPEQTQWHASIQAAIRAVRERYDIEEAAWRLGG